MSFSVIKHADGTVSGEVQTSDKGLVFYAHAKVYGLEVTGNMAKLAFHFTRGNLNSFYPPGVEITDIYGWMVVIDNGEGSKATGPDLISLTVFTDGSDILPYTIAELDPMGPEDYLDAMTGLFGLPYEQFIFPPENGNVRIR
jgi:hypothetical protein